MTSIPQAFSSIVKLETVSLVGEKAKLFAGVLLSDALKGVLDFSQLELGKITQNGHPYAITILSAQLTLANTLGLVEAGIRNKTTVDFGPHEQLVIHFVAKALHPELGEVFQRLLSDGVLTDPVIDKVTEFAELQGLREDMGNYAELIRSKTSQKPGEAAGSFFGKFN